MAGEINLSATDGTLRAALSGLAKRQKVTANNVANLDTPGFKVSEVPFEEQLQRALAARAGAPSAELVGTDPRHFSTVPDRLSDMEPRVRLASHTAVRGDGNNVDIDRQMVDLAGTGITYSAVTQLLSARYGLLRTIINDGRR